MMIDKIRCESNLTRKMLKQKSKWFANSTKEDRLLFLAVFLAICFSFTAFFLYTKGYIRLGFSDDCAFKRNYGIPCPTCYWTTAFNLIVKGGTIKALYVQPAATISCFILIFVAFFSLLSSVLGVNFVFLPPVRLWRVGYILAVAAAIVLLGWAVTLLRALA